MGDGPQGLLAQITAIPWIAVIVALVLLIIYLAKFTDALRKLHEFGKNVCTELNGKRGPEAELQKEFDALRRNVLHCGITNNIPLEMHKLRKFLVENGFVERPDVRQFFDKWLSSPWVIIGAPVANALTYEQIKVLGQELRGLQL